MADIFDPTGQKLLDESIERIYPDAPAVDVPNPDVIEGQGSIVPVPEGEVIPPSQQPLVNEVSELEQLNIRAQRATEEPAVRYRPLNASVSFTELTSAEQNEFDAAGAIAPLTQPQLPTQAIANYVQSNATVPTWTGPTTVDSPSEPWQTDYFNLQQVWADRASRAQAQAIAPAITSPFAGVTRGLTSGQPFGTSAIETARNFIERTTGISFAGVEESEREETEPNTWADVAQSIVIQGLSNPFGGASVLANVVMDSLGFPDRLRVPMLNTPDDIGTFRRISEAVGRETFERIGNRISDVGLGRFIGENIFERSGPGALRGRIRAYQRGQNPLAIFQEPTEFVGSGLNYYGELSPDQDDSFFAGLAERSPDFRNLIRDLQPALDEAGRARFNPGAGYFGEFGNAGSLSALLYLANIPEGLITGALYDVADLTRAGTSRTPLAGILSRVNPLFSTPPSEEQLQRIDILGAFFGRDTGFTQEWSEDNYLAFIGNPALDWVPQGFGLQTGAAFIADLVVGGIADFGIDNVVRRATVRASRAGAETVEQAAESTTSVGVRQLELDLGMPSQQQLELELNVPSVSVVESTDDVASPGQLNLFSVPESQQLGLDLFPTTNRPVRATQLELDYTVYPRQLEFDFTYNGPNSAARVTRGVQRNLPSGRSLYGSLGNNSVVQRLANSFGNILTRAERAVRTVDLPNLRVPTQPQIFVRLADTNADVRAFISNGRRPLFARTGAENELAVNEALRRNVERLRGIRNEIDNNEALIADAATSPAARSLSSDELAIDNLAMQQLEESNNNLRSAASRIENDIIGIQTTAESINEVNDEIARLLGIPESGAFVRALNEDFPIDLSVVQVDDVLPLDYRFPADSVLASYVKPLTSSNQFTFARRSDEEILSLARFWGDAGRDVIFDNLAQARLSDVYRLRSLRKLDPQMYGRAGKSLPQIDSQRNVVDIAAVDDQRVSMIPDAVDAEPSVPGVDPSLPLTTETRKLVEDEIRATAQYYESTRQRLNQKLAKGQPTQNLPAQIEDAENLLNRIFADYPELAERELLESLPEGLRPQGIEAQAIAPEYVATQQQTISAGQELQQMQIDLMELEDVVEQTQQQLNSLPQLQRINPADEFATRRMMGDNSVPTANSEKLKPVSIVRVNEEQLSVFSSNARLTPTPRQTSRARAQAQGFDDERIGQAILDIRADNAIEGVEFEPDVRALRQVVNRVDGMTYRQAQAALKAYPGVRRVGNTDELKERLFTQYVRDYRRAEIEGNEEVLRSLGVSIRDPQAESRIFYHGSRASSLDVPSTSLTNEYGIGLYVSESSDTAWRYAKAQPAEDLVDLDLDFRTQLDEPRVFTVGTANAVEVNTLDNAAPLDFVIADMNHPVVQEQYREVIQDLLKVYEPGYANRFRNWAKNKHPNQYLHYIRSQFLKDNRGQLPHFEFLQLLNNSLRARDIDALRDGDNIVILSRNYEIGQVATSTSTLEEAIRNRVAVDQDLASRVPNRTTETILVQDDLALGTYARNNMRNSVADQERATLDSVRELNDVEQRLDNAVRADDVIQEQRNLDELARDANRQGSSSLRNDDLCL